MISEFCEVFPAQNLQPSHWQAPMQLLPYAVYPWVEHCPRLMSQKAEVTEDARAEVTEEVQAEVTEYKLAVKLMPWREVAIVEREEKVMAAIENGVVK